MEPDIGSTAGRFCPCCGHHARSGFRPGPGGRPGAKCPRCRSLERHRFLAVLVAALRPGLGDVDVLLDVAPAPQARPALAALEPSRYVRLDLLPARGVDLRGDLTRLPLRDGVVDLLHCYHVLEHVPDDRAAMAELRRVMAPGGVGLVQVPWRPGTTTDEDPAAPPEERVRRFGLADHVRYYGDDVEDRLLAAGFAVTRVTPADYVGEQMNTWLGLGTDESVWVVRPARRPGAPVRVLSGAQPLGTTLDAALRDLARAREERRAARRDARRPAGAGSME